MSLREVWSRWRESRRHPLITVYTAPMLDTGIGQEAGYANDDEFRAAMQAEREAMDPVERAAVEAIEADMERQFLFGGEGR